MRSSNEWTENELHHILGAIKTFIKTNLTGEIRSVQIMEVIRQVQNTVFANEAHKIKGPKAFYYNTVRPLLADWGVTVRETKSKRDVSSAKARVFWTEETRMRVAQTFFDMSIDFPMENRMPLVKRVQSLVLPAEERKSAANAAAQISKALPVVIANYKKEQQELRQRTKTDLNQTEFQQSELNARMIDFVRFVNHGFNNVEARLDKLHGLFEQKLQPEANRKSAATPKRAVWLLGFTEDQAQEIPDLDNYDIEILEELPDLADIIMGHQEQRAIVIHEDVLSTKQRRMLKNHDVDFHVWSLDSETAALSELLSPITDEVIDETDENWE